MVVKTEDRIRRRGYSAREDRGPKGRFDERRHHESGKCANGRVVRRLVKLIVGRGRQKARPVLRRQTDDGMWGDTVCHDSRARSFGKTRMGTHEHHDTHKW
jgi:hypothetical protein